VGTEATTKQIGTVTDTTDRNADGLHVISDNSSVKPFTVDVKLNGKPLSMELDTDATISLISESTSSNCFQGLRCNSQAQNYIPIWEELS